MQAGRQSGQTGKNGQAEGHLLKMEYRQVDGNAQKINWH